jgi:hypothetical protein
MCHPASASYPKSMFRSSVLNYFRISEVDGKIAIDYHKIHKDQPQDMSLLQRLLV